MRYLTTATFLPKEERQMGPKQAYDRGVAVKCHWDEEALKKD